MLSSEAGLSATIESITNLKGVTLLKNRYFIMRHGQSEANAAGLITSDPVYCATHYGLTAYGKDQVAASVKKAKHKGWIGALTIIYCSDFKRTAETAALAREVLTATKVCPDPALRERSFGAYNGKRVDSYIELWPQDQRATRGQQEKGVEGPKKILDRLLGFIEILEARHRGECILLVSHGDPLQVLQAAFAGLKPEQSRRLKYIEPAEIRELTLQ